MVDSKARPCNHDNGASNPPGAGSRESRTRLPAGLRPSAWAPTAWRPSAGPGASAWRPRPRPASPPSAAACEVVAASALPSRIASASRAATSSIARIESSLPGIGRSTTIGIAVGVDQGDGRDAHLAGLVDRVLLLLGIEHDEALRQPGERADAAEVAEHLAVLAAQRRLHLLGVGREGVAGDQGLELLEPGQPVADRAEVGERAPEPAVADIGHAAAAGLAGDRLGPLPLGAHKQHQAAGGGDLLEILAGPEQTADRLADVDDVDEVLAAVDVGPHLRVPAAGAVAEMHAGFDQFLGQDVRHAR